MYFVYVCVCVHMRACLCVYMFMCVNVLGVLEAETCYETLAGPIFPTIAGNQNKSSGIVGFIPFLGLFIYLSQGGVLIS